jgi:hypothetical protein
MKIENTYLETLNKLGIMILLVFTMSLFSTQIYAINENWWDNTFEYRKNISITNPNASPLSDFVIYLNISKETAMQADYDDLRFTSGTCTGSSNSVFYDYEIEYSDVTKAVVWIKVPSFVSGTNNLCMYYGNSTTASGTSTNVWTNNYGLVYHMETAGNDFSPNNRDKVSNIGTPVQGTDWLGYKETFDGNDAWNLANLAYWEAGWSTRTHETVFETSSDVTTRQVIFSEGGGTNGVTLYILSGQLYARWWSESTGFGGGHVNTSITNNTKYYASMSYDFPGEYNLYLDGIKINGVATTATMNAHSGDGGIAYTGSTSKDFHDVSNSAGHYFDGIIHELWTQDITNSDDFISARNSNLLNHDVNTVYNIAEQWLPTITNSITIPNPSLVYFIEQDNTTTVQAQINCTGPAFTTCSNVSSKLQIKTGPSSFADVATSSSSPAWTNSSLTQSCILDGGDNCVLNWNLNVTDIPLASNIFRIISNSSNTLYTNDIFSENLTINVLGQYALSFSYVSYNFPSFEKLSGDKTVSVDVKADKGINNNVVVSCISGDCTRITDNFVDGNGLTQPATSNFNFTCQDNIFGSFSAVYRVTSTEFPTGTDITLTCDVTAIYGPINTIINSPSTTNETTVGKDILFKVNSTTTCIGLCGEISSYLVYDSNFGDFSDGDLTVTAINTIVNDYTYLIDDELISDNNILVNDGTNFGVGDEILIWQVQNGSESGIAGTYEFRIISNVDGNNLKLFNGLNNSYYSGNFDMVGASVTQVVRVPNFEDVIVNVASSITAPAWNGYYGGIVIFRSNTLTQIGTIDVSEKGFRGGDCNGCGDSAWGDQGEGYLGTGIGALAANGNGGGGGYGPSGFNGEPGAGGGLGTAGANGVSSFTSLGGTSIGDTDITNLFMGGGAGGGGDDDNPTIKAQYVDGAGAVMIFSKDSTNVNILANGEDGVGNTGAAGTTGGGAGGTVWITSENISITQISAIGGIGFIDADDTGGNGGVGRIRLDYYNSSGAAPNPVAGKIGNISLNYPTFVPTLTSNIPFYTIGPQPKTCVSTEDGSCSFEWLVNATGPMNTTNNFNVWSISNISVINSSQSPTFAKVKIFNSLPEIFIINPKNSSKLIGDGNFQFIFNVTDLDDGLLTCNIFLDGINFVNRTCNTGSVITIDNLLSFGVHNWSVYVADTKGGVGDTGTIWFNYYQSNHQKITKSISRSGVNIYDVKTNVENYVNATSNTIVPEFVTTGFNIGSISPFFDFTNLTSGFYTGSINVWDISIIPLGTFNGNYALTNTGQNKVKNNFVVGLE